MSASDTPYVIVRKLIHGQYVDVKVYEPKAPPELLPTDSDEEGALDERSNID